MSLFDRMRTPFSELADNDPGPAPNRGHGVGELLRERRDELGLDIESIGEALRIKPVFLAAIEQGRTEDLPGPTYAIGFVRAYASYLGLDGDRVLDSYKAESAEVQARPDLALPVPLGERSLPGGPILLVGVIVALCGYGTWYYLSTGERSRPERVAAVPAELRQLATPTPASPGAAAPSARADTAAAVNTRAATTASPQFGSGLTQPEPDPPAVVQSPVLPAGSPAAPEAAARNSSPAPTAGQAPVPAPAAPVPAPPAASRTAAASPPSANDAVAATPITATPGAATPGAAAGGIDIRAVADCWIQIRAPDQTIVFSRVLKAGETYRVPRPGLVMRTGNAGALSIMVDGKPAPSLGAIGTLRRNVALEPNALLSGTAVRG